MIHPRVHLIHLGRNGAGPAILEELIRAHQNLGLEVNATWSALAENSTGLSEICPDGNSFVTYRDRGEFIRGIPRAVAAAMRISKQVQLDQTDYVLSSMGSPWQWIFAASFRLRGVRYFAAVHDVVLHSGERSLLLDLYRSIEPLIANGLVFFSEFSRREAQNAGRQYRRKSTVVPHGLLAAPKQHQVDDFEAHSGGGLKIGVIGRLVEYKGLGKLPEIISTVRDSHADAVIEVWGDGDRSLLQGMSDIEGISLNVGWIPDGELSSLVRSMDVLILPYEEATQSGLIPLAQSNGVPVVVSPVGALPEQVECGELGFVAAGTSATAMAEAIIRATKSTDAPRVVDQARASVAPRGRRSWESAVQELVVFASGTSGIETGGPKND